MNQAKQNELMERAFHHLQSVVRMDSQSDERSTTVPSTEGQKLLGDFVAAHFESCGFKVERDSAFNVIATRSGRKNGKPIETEPYAFLVHLDTVRGTGNPEKLYTIENWDGSPIPYPKNPALKVDVEHYPDTRAFLGQTVIYGDGDRPFGLDDKLGLTYLMTLAEWIHKDESLDHPSLLLVGRPDEEIGSMKAVAALADSLAERGVKSGYTVDGILPFEVNIQNFNGGHARASFPMTPIEREAKDELLLDIQIGGVNTHGATAKPEGHRGALRLAAELLEELENAGVDAFPYDFASDTLRDCDGRLVLGTEDEDAVKALLSRVMTPHLSRGASFSIKRGSFDRAVQSGFLNALHAVSAFSKSRDELPGGGPLWAEESDGWEGYSQPYRMYVEDGEVVVDIRLRDFKKDMLEERKAHVVKVFQAEGAKVSTKDQYVNMGPRLESRRDLVDAALLAGQDANVEVKELPIRGGTGVDPFLEKGTAIANIGTGYFSPESEKELTTLELMGQHMCWIFALCGRLLKEG